MQKGLEALAQYVERDGAIPGRGHVEILADGTEYRTGIWIGNQKARRDKLDTAQLRALAGLGAVGRVAAQNAVLTTVCPAR